MIQIVKYNENIWEVLMYRYILRRIITIIPIIMIISAISFFAISYSPGDPARNILGQYASEQQVRELRAKLNIDRPIAVQYFDYMKGVFKGDFGISWISRRPVAPDILNRFPVTLRLAFFSTLISIIISIPMGIYSSMRQYSAFDNISVVIVLFLSSMPGFWLGLLLILLFSVNLGWLPASGVKNWQGYIMPVITLGLLMTAPTSRIMRTSMVEALKQDYVRTAYAKGSNELRATFNHALRNALIPVVTSIGITFGYMLGGALVIEKIFELPGLGTLAAAAVSKKDVPMAVTSVMFIATMFTIVTLLTDLVYGFIDPRIKAQYKKYGGKHE